MTDRERDRNAARQLAILRHAREITGNVSRTCRYYGITRQAYYTWLRRYEELGLEGLRDRSRRPHVSPECHQDRGGRQDRLPPPELPLRPPQDRHVPEALPRWRDQPVRGVADPE